MKEQCLLNSRSYSHGAITCQNNKEFQCYDGEWVETGRDCASLDNLNKHTYLAFSLREKGSVDSLENEEIHFLRERDDGNPICLTTNTDIMKCFHTYNSIDNRSIEIYNSCLDNKMLTIRWNSSGTTIDKSYRLMRRTARTILISGSSGAVIKESDWDFSYGEDVSTRIKTFHEELYGDKVWYMQNPFPNFVCFKFAWKEGKTNYEATGIAPPNETTPFTISGTKGIPGLISARADPT